MRQRHGQSFALVSLATVFLLQGALMWVISLPIQVAAAQPERLGRTRRPRLASSPADVRAGGGR